MGEFGPKALGPWHMTDCVCCLYIQGSVIAFCVQGSVQWLTPGFVLNYFPDVTGTSLITKCKEFIYNSCVIFKLNLKT